MLMTSTMILDEIEKSVHSATATLITISSVIDTLNLIIVVAEGNHHSSSNFSESSQFSSTSVSLPKTVPASEKRSSHRLLSCKKYPAPPLPPACRNPVISISSPSSTPLKPLTSTRISFRRIRHDRNSDPRRPNEDLFCAIIIVFEICSTLQNIDGKIDRIIFFRRLFFILHEISDQILPTNHRKICRLNSDSEGNQDYKEDQKQQQQHLTEDDHNFSNFKSIQVSKANPILERSSQKLDVDVRRQDDPTSTCFLLNQKTGSTAILITHTITICHIKIISIKYIIVFSSIVRFKIGVKDSLLFTRILDQLKKGGRGRSLPLVDFCCCSSSSLYQTYRLQEVTTIEEAAKNLLSSSAPSDLLTPRLLYSTFREKILFLILLSLNRIFRVFLFFSSAVFFSYCDPRPNSHPIIIIFIFSANYHHNLVTPSKQECHLRHHPSQPSLPHIRLHQHPAPQHLSPRRRRHRNRRRDPA